MDFIKYIEYSIFLIIIILQIRSFVKTASKIKEFQFAIPLVADIQIVGVSLTQNQIESFVSNGLLGDIGSYKQNTNDEDEELDIDSIEVLDTSDFASKREIKIVSSKDKSTIFFNILSSLNKYLVRNRHAVTDFNLVKDIVERNTDILEEEINLTLSTPLYLGLMGTMLGIVLGLFNMSSLFDSPSDTHTVEGIAVLLDSVKVAMVASLFGLVLTIYNSTIIFKGTKYKLEAKKNEFYTFIQVELLPLLNQGLGSTFESLQRNLSKFNEKFDSNLNRLSSVFDKNYESILLQKKLMEQMDRSKVSEMTRYNVQVLKELNIAVQHFDHFNKLFGNLNLYINNSYQLTDKTNELLQRTGNFETIANSIGSSVSKNDALLDFLTHHLSDLESHKAAVNASVVNVSFGIKDIFEELKGSLHKESQALNKEIVNRNQQHENIFTELTKMLKDSFEKQNQAVQMAMEEKKSNLDYLKILEPILSELKSYKSTTANASTGNGSDRNGSDKLYNQLVKLNMMTSSSNQMLRRMEEDSKTPFFKKIFNMRDNEKR